MHACIYFTYVCILVMHGYKLMNFYSVEHFHIISPILNTNDSTFQWTEPIEVTPAASDAAEKADDVRTVASTMYEANSEVLNVKTKSRQYVSRDPNILGIHLGLLLR
jgi:hypothetical protein